MIHAPWTAEQCAKLNEWQACGWVHGFTCGNCSPHQTLIAEPHGWRCPNGCGWQQAWAHEFMLRGAPPDPRVLLGGAPAARGVLPADLAALTVTLDWTAIAIHCADQAVLGRVFMWLIGQVAAAKTQEDHHETP